jgi:hypothetical protein
MIFTKQAVIFPKVLPQISVTALRLAFATEKDEDTEVKKFN